MEKNESLSFFSTVCPDSGADTKENPYIICPTGVTADDDLASDADNGDLRTCSECIKWGKKYEIGFVKCGRFEIDVYNCCPSVPENPCIICPNGVPLLVILLCHQMKGGHAGISLSVQNVFNLGPTKDCRMYMMATIAALLMVRILASYTKWCHFCDD
jgi:hypothetical protein